MPGLSRRWSLSPLQLAAALVVLVAGGAIAGFLVHSRGHGPAAPTTSTGAGAPVRTSTTAPASTGSTGAGTTTTPPTTTTGGTGSTTTAAPGATSSGRTGLLVASTSPAARASGVSGTTPISVTFSSPLSSSSPMPQVVPSVPGRWTRPSPATVTFTPSEPFVPLAVVTVTIPSGAGGALASNGATLATTSTLSFQVRDGSMLRLQQLLSLLDYSPLAWTPTSAATAPSDAATQLQAAYAPPAGKFAWRTSTWPAQLTSLWRPGVYDVMTRGLVMSFEADHGLIVNGRIGPGLWNDLLGAVASGTLNTGGYNFALGNKTPPEALTIWHNGAVVLHVPANTGIAQSPTADGVYPVFARYRNQVMHGTNPGGSKYADPVQFVAYFNGGDAVHYLARADYGIPQSLGCIELPLTSAAAAWPYLAYGTLVDVIG